jgi:Uma2 family endonuclease
LFRRQTDAPLIISETPKSDIPSPDRWTREDYYRLGDLGFFPPDARVELIDGEILKYADSQQPLHTVMLHATANVLRSAFGVSSYIREQSPMTLADDSEPEPDILVVRGAIRDYKQDKHPGPTDTLLLVEISDSTLAYDRTRKAALYAAAGITEYWIVNVVAQQLEVHRSPQGDAYQETTVYNATQTVTPLAAPHASILVGELFP